MFAVGFDRHGAHAASALQPLRRKLASHDVGWRRQCWCELLGNGTQRDKHACFEDTLPNRANSHDGSDAQKPSPENDRKPISYGASGAWGNALRNEQIRQDPENSSVVQKPAAG